MGLLTRYPAFDAFINGIGEMSFTLGGGEGMLSLMAGLRSTKTIYNEDSQRKPHFTYFRMDLPGDSIDINSLPTSIKRGDDGVGMYTPVSPPLS